MYDFKTLNQRVTGSNPVVPTIQIKICQSILELLVKERDINEKPISKIYIFDIFHHWIFP